MVLSSPICIAKELVSGYAPYNLGYYGLYDVVLISFVSPDIICPWDISKSGVTIPRVPKLSFYSRFLSFT